MTLANLGLAIDSSQADKGTIALNKFTSAAKQTQAAAAGLTGQTTIAATAARSLASGIEAEAGALAKATAATRAAANANDVYARSLNNTRMATANVASQMSDIGVSLASGQSWWLVAIQQSSQLQHALGGMGVRGALAAVGTGFMSLLNPVSLATFAFVGLGAAAADYFLGVEEGSDKSEDALRREADLVQRVAEKWGSVLPELQKYAEARAKILDANERQRAVGVQIDESFANAQKALDRFIAAAAAEIDKPFRGIADGATELIKDFSGIEAAARAYNKEAKNSGDTSDEFARLQTALSGILKNSALPATGALRDAVNALAAAYGAAATEAEGLLATNKAIDGLPGKQGRLPRMPSEGEFNDRWGGRYAAPWEDLFPDLYRGGRSNVHVPTPRPNDIQRLDWEAEEFERSRRQGYQRAYADISYQTGPDQWRLDLKSDIAGFASDFRGALLDNGGDIGEALAQSLGNALIQATDRMMDQAIGTFLDAMLGTSKTSTFKADRGGFASLIFGGSSAAVTPSSVSRMFAPANSNTNMSVFRSAISAIESSGRYDALGPWTGGDRAYGRYQVMGNNIGPWSRAALGREISSSDFLSNPGLQDQIFDHRFGGYVEKYGPSGAAQAWFGGPGSVGKGGRGADILGTTGNAYVEKFNAQIAKMGGVAGGATEALAGFGGGLGQLGQALMQVGGGGAGGGGGWFSALSSALGGIGGATSFMMGISPAATRAIASGSWGLYDQGGFTGHGGRLDPAGIVHKGEFVFDAASTARIGVQNLERMRRMPGFDQGGFAGPASASGGLPAGMHITWAWEKDGDGNIAPVIRNVVQKETPGIARAQATGVMGEYNHRMAKGGSASQNQRYSALRAGTRYG